MGRLVLRCGLCGKARDDRSLWSLGADDVLKNCQHSGFGLHISCPVGRDVTLRWPGENTAHCSVKTRGYLRCHLERGGPRRTYGISLATNGAPAASQRMVRNMLARPAVVLWYRYPLASARGSGQAPCNIRLLLTVRPTKLGEGLTSVANLQRKRTRLSRGQSASPSSLRPNAYPGVSLPF
jgi:hypothetical protein